MKLQHGHTYRTRCGWVGELRDIGGEMWLVGKEVEVKGYDMDDGWWYTENGLFVGEEDNPDFPMHVVEEVTDLPGTARASLIESLRNIALAWQEPLAKAHMIALLEIIDELQKPLDNGGGM